ncbi:MAG: tetratricopeptide repeat protein [Candidatus Omnitrophota bacterium]
MIRLLLFIKRHAWPIAFVLLLGLGILLGTIFYWFPFRGAQAETFALERQLNERKIEKASLQKLFDTLKEKYKTLEADRDNIMVQAKQLLAEKDTLLNAEDQVKALTAENQKLLENHKALEKSFEAVQAQARDLKGPLETALAEAAASKAEIARISQENENRILEFRESAGRIQKLEEDVAYYKGFQESFLSLSQSYDTLKKERKFLEAQLDDLPKKFSKMARENKILVKETGDMHYNLGVFYAGEMNYDRAIEEFKKAVDINPNDAKAQYNLGYIYAEQRQDRKKAEYYFRNFLGLAPDDPNSDAVKSYLVERDVFSTNVLKS